MLSSSTEFGRSFEVNQEPAGASGRISCAELDKGGSAKSGKIKIAAARGLTMAALASLWWTPAIGQTLQKLGDAQVVLRSANNIGEIAGAANGEAFIYRAGQFSSLGTLAGYTGSDAHAISESGAVAGTSSINDVYRAFLYTNGRMTDLGTLGGTRSYGYAVNNWGDVAGQSTTAGDTDYHAFLYSSGQMVDLGSLGGRMSSARGINDSGEVVGFSLVSGNQQAHAFHYAQGQMRDLGTLGGTYSNAAAINARGQIAGTSATSSSTLHAFLYEAGEMKDLGVLERTEHSDAFAVNNLGQVVGRCYSSSGYEPAFLYSDGKMQDLNVLFEHLLTDGTELGFAVLVEASAITDDGIIAGFGWYYMGEERGRKKYELAPFLLDTKIGAAAP